MPRVPTSATSLYDSKAPALTAAVQDVIAAAARGGDSGGAFDRLHESIWQVLALGDLMGRARVLSVADEASIEAAEAVPMFGGVTFQQAVDAIIERNPLLAQAPDFVGGKPRFVQVQEFYRDGPGFALAKSTELKVTRRAQAIIERAMSDGMESRDAIDQIAALSEDFSTAYAENVFRTNLNTASTAGTFDMASDPVVRVVAPLMHYSATKDVSTRKNHLAMHGTAAPVEHAIWNERSTPAGYACRCTLDLLTKPMARRMGLMTEDGRLIVRIPNPGVRADPGFGTRPVGAGAV